MQIELRRTGARRYTVSGRRADQPLVEFQGPGFDPLMPHDLLPLIVESDAARSERATYFCLCEWLRRSPDARRRRRAAELWAHSPPRPPDGVDLSEPVLARICARMDELGARWASLEVGQALTVEWSLRRQPAAPSMVRP